MASGVALPVATQLCRSRCMPATLCEWRPLAHNNQLSSSSASLLHNSSVTSLSDIITIQDDKDFETRVLNCQKPVIVNFGAGWCPPCRRFTPILESLVSGKDGKVVLAKIEVDEHTDLALDNEVQAVPTVIAMKDGKVIDKFVGLKDEADLETFVEKLIG